jgi:hypothetical protein
MRFCQIDGTPLVGDDGTDTILQGPSDDLLDVPSAPVNTSADREQPLMEIPGFEPEPQKPADYAAPPPPPPPSPFSPPADSSYQQAKDEEIRSTFGQDQPSSWTPAPAPPPPAPMGQWQQGGTTPTAPFSTSQQIGGPDQTMAIVSLVLGVLSILCCGFVTGVPAIIVGFMAKNKADANPATHGGRGLAIAGIVTGAIGVLFGIIGLIYYVAVLSTLPLAN